jgi:hypothetical protein
MAIEKNDNPKIPEPASADTCDAAARDGKGRFLTGNIGGGRPRGSRNRLSDMFLENVAKDFSIHGGAVLAQVRQADPTGYLRMIATLIPKELITQREKEAGCDYADFSDEELLELYEREKRRAMARAMVQEACSIRRY